MLPTECILNDKLWSRITTSSHLSSRLAVMYTANDALRLFEDAERIPQTETRAVVLKEFNIKIDGTMVVPHSQSAAFYHAFENYLPRVLKVPRDCRKVTAECALFDAIGREVSEIGLALVPVSSLRLKGEKDEELASHTKIGSAVKLFNQGIIMPSYACTLHEIPKPISNEYALKLLNRLAPAISFIHDKKWLHGDVKSSNIFIDSAGLAWLGDYGSSQPYSKVKFYAGGTPPYQCQDVSYATHSRLFDNLGLVISVLDKLGVLDIVHNESRSLADVVGTIERSEVLNPELEELLLVLVKLI